MRVWFFTFYLGFKRRVLMGNGSELKNPYAHIQQEITMEGIPHPKFQRED